MRKHTSLLTARNAGLVQRYRAIARHYWEKLLTNTLGRISITSRGRRLRSFVNGLSGPRPHPNVRVAIVAHVYYVDLADEIVNLRNIFPSLVPVYLTVPKENLRDLNAIVADRPNIFLHAYENRGRDILPFLQLLGSGALDSYDAVLKLHTKRSPHLIDGDLRRRLLFAMLCGERNATYRAIKAFEEEDTGLVGWQDCYRTDPIYWMANQHRVSEICSRMQASEFMELGFFEGSMFWFRPAAFDALRQLNILPHEFEAEAGQLDGTLHHAVERCFTIAARAEGFKVRNLRGGEL